MSIIKDILMQHDIKEDQALKFDQYYKMIFEWNEKINLTAITDESEAAYKHFIDCLACFKCGKISPGAKIIDVGTGAGFPGIPLKICDPTLDVTLMDSLNKRITFLNEVINGLSLKAITAVHARAEELGKNKKYREKYDICVSRAVANLASLSELCLPFVKTGGYFLSMKGPKADEEQKNAERAIELMGGKTEDIFRYDIADEEYKRNMVIIKKISETPVRYPRKAPKPVKEPLV
ncbi:MAG: 16S rRNA (guanine(527)-N(7))-methyltransferase RsmG [Clostridia bacterium]|nr:16S rRNA (guanine(527)-N(7))-methyltransferase RsmG [Clostridia bacterium]